MKNSLVVGVVQKIMLLWMALLGTQCHCVEASTAFVSSAAPAVFGSPPIGAKYEKEVGIPVLGRQKFSLEILSDNMAHLLVNGMLILDELVPYTLTKNGCLNCRLSDRAQQKLKTFRTSLKEVGYNVETDTPYVKVRTPLPALIKIKLHRQHNVQEEQDQELDNIQNEEEETEDGMEGYEMNAPLGVHQQ